MSTFSKQLESSDSTDGDAHQLFKDVINAQKARNRSPEVQSRIDAIVTKKRVIIPRTMERNYEEDKTLE